MTRRLYLTLFFAVLLMFGQQQAMVHSYVHTADWQQKSSNEGKSTNHSEVCGKCVSLAGLGAAVSSQAHTFHIATGQFEFFTVLTQAVISQRFLPYLSRAPPNLA